MCACTSVSLCAHVLCTLGNHAITHPGTLHGPPSIPPGPLSLAAPHPPARHYHQVSSTFHLTASCIHYSCALSSGGPLLAGFSVLCAHAPHLSQWTFSGTPPQVGWSIALSPHALSRCAHSSFISTSPSCLLIPSNLSCFRQMAALSQPLHTIADPLPPQTAQQSDRQKLISSTPRSSLSTDRRLADSSSAFSITSSHARRHASSASISTLPRSQRSASGILSRAAAALDRTHSAIVSISEPVIRPRQSTAALSRLSLVPAALQSSGEPSSPEKTTSPSNPSTQSPQSLSGGDIPPTTIHSVPQPARDYSPPPLQPEPSLEDIDPDQFVHTNKMHQTSSRLLRMTDDDRPFTRVCFLTAVFSPLFPMLALGPLSASFSFVSYASSYQANYTSA